MHSFLKYPLSIVLTIVAALGHAEEYAGVHELTHQYGRAQLKVLATEAAHSPNPFSEAAGSKVIERVSMADRVKVHGEAVARAHDPFQSLDRRAFYRDQIPAAFLKARTPFASTATLPK